MKATIKNILRPVRDIIYAFFGYMYDFIRYYKYAGWKAGNRLSVRDFKAVKIYHRLEKSLSFRNRNAQSGRGAATDLVRQLKKSGVQSDAFTFHEKVGLKVLGNYLEVSSREGGDKRDPLVEYWQKNKASAEKIGGILNTDISTLQQGKLENPEDFFSSRFSVRDFSQKNVPPEDLARAIDLALNTPSVCNRQAWFTYCLHSREGIDRALSLQNGNRGFGHEVPCLLLLCADLSAFDTAGERNQQWIDGGMYSMSLIWALHSLGYASCCLNWSKGPIDDIKLRKLVPIKGEHTVLMMLAVGLPRDDLKVCESARKPAELLFKELE